MIKAIMIDVHRMQQRTDGRVVGGYTRKSAWVMAGMLETTKPIQKNKSENGPEYGSFMKEMREV